MADLDPNSPAYRDFAPERLPQPAGYWLQRQPADFRKGFASLATFETLDAGDIIWRIGEEIDFMLGIVEGCVAHSWATPDNEVSLSHLWWQGDWFGEAEFSCRTAAFTITQARTPVKIAKVEFRKLRAMLDENPQWWACITELATEHTILAGDTIMDLMLHDPTARCIAALLRAAGGRIQSGQTIKSSRIPISQGELAILTNLHRNSVVNILRRLSEDGLVAHHYREIEITNPTELRRRVLEHSGLNDLKIPEGK